MRDTYGTNVSTIWREQLAQHRSHRFKRLRCRTGYGFPATAVPEQRQRGPLPVSRRLVVTKGINNGRQLQRVLREMQGQTRLRRGYRGNQRAPDGQGNLPGLRHQDEPDPGQSLTSPAAAVTGSTPDGHPPGSRCPRPPAGWGRSPGALDGAAAVVIRGWPRRRTPRRR